MVIWMIIVNGPDVPTKRDVKGNIVLKKDSEWTAEEKKNVEIKAKAINIIHCATSFEKFTKVSRRKIAKGIWDKLQLTHEGTKQDKETRVNMIMNEYEMFFMIKNESIDALFERFSIIINNLDAMGKYFFEVKLGRKILRSRTKQ
ncbi:uncharacterized protein LOC107636818 [Arachis ipaensis]|uniref:uncharacterized protein LOC107636818 n=1 Tax=Arachis ipaensis TaxID=130454 RepID=UPI0007AF1438|nr:uncharacterized protein LOC107636818 [Arachis ipaensis]